MGIKRIALLAGMALAAVALAVPAAASASGTWTDDHVKLKKDATLSFTGNVKFSLAGVLTYTCSTHIEGKLTASYGKGTGVKTGTGHVEKYETTTDTCVGSGLLTGCQLVSHSVSTLPLMLTATEKDIDVVDKAKHTYGFGAGCPISSVQLEFGPTTLHLDDALTFSEIEIEGTTETGVVASGTLALEEGAATYGVHEPKKPGEEEEEEEGRLFN